MQIRAPADALGQLYRHLRQHFAPALDNQHIVFDANTTHPREVDTRLDRENHPWGHGHGRPSRVRLGDSGILVHFKPEAMAGAVTEGVCEPVLLQRFSRCVVDIGREGSGAHGRDSSRVRIRHSGEEAAKLH